MISIQVEKPKKRERKEPKKERSGKKEAAAPPSKKEEEAAEGQEEAEVKQEKRKVLPPAPKSNPWKKVSGPTNADSATTVREPKVYLDNRIPFPCQWHFIKK